MSDAATVEKPRVNMAAKLRKKGYHSEEAAIRQPDTLHLPALGEALERESDIIVVDEKALQKVQKDALAFSNEPIVIRLDPPTEDNPPHCFPCWVNGKGAEIFQDGRWIAYGAFPYGVDVVTRRKYVEVLARALRTRVNAGYDKFPRHEDNWVKKTHGATVSFHVVQDPNPKGQEWLRRIRHFI